MSSQWTNKYAIMRDLSMAQGCVPVDVDKIVTADQKPPAPLITQDTEEEFYGHAVSGGDFSPPDLGLIRQMLDLVRDTKVLSDSEDEEQKMLQISKLNPIDKEFVIQKKVETELSLDTDSNVKPVIKNEAKKIRSINNKRNVAVTSILESIANRLPLPNGKADVKIAQSQDLKTLLMSNEPQQSQTMTNSVKKVSSWLDSNQKGKIKKTPLLMDPSTMFKKKVATSQKQVEERVVVVKSPLSNSTHYKPTEQATELYKKYLEKSQLKSQITQDIWAKAQREMEEIDHKKKQEAEQAMLASPCSTLTGSEAGPSDESPPVAVPLSDARLDIVRLPQHRHLLTGECIVCKVLCNNTFRETVKIRKM